MKFLTVLLPFISGIPDGLVEMEGVLPCREGGPFNRNSAIVQTIGRVKSVKINQCDTDETLKNSNICGLRKGTEKKMYIEHNFENAHLKLAKGKPIKKFPKRGQTMKINICGHVLSGNAKKFCAPFALPQTNACKLGYPCSQRKIKFKSVAEREKSRFLAVGVPVAAAYPNVKVVSKWEVKDPSNPHAPPLFCVYIPFAVLK